MRDERDTLLSADAVVHGPPVLPQDRIRLMPLRFGGGLRVLILAATHGVTRNVLECTHALGIEVHVLGTGRARLISDSPYCAEYTHVSPLEFFRPGRHLVMQVMRYCTAHRISTIIPINMASIRLAAAVRDECPDLCFFPFDNLAILEMLNNKWSFKVFLEASGIPTPRTQLITNYGDIGRVDLEFPVLIKPLVLGGALGIQRFDNRDALVRAFCSWSPPSFPVIVQEYIAGQDISLSLLSARGEIVAWAIHRYLDTTTTTTIEFIRDPVVLEIGTRIVSLCHFTGLANLDMRLDARDQKIKVLECNPRFWFTINAALEAGVNFVQLGIALAHGNPMPESIYHEATVELKVDPRQGRR